ncbi:unnamed protein product [Thlaspi arvense]|uniref:FBD domain-containing protein n=1 Tax=Thlaspi arvense TaxID=13288 RepID=A0AAU9SGW9_THLAR|nr:unnamed protein product [Thlaspi arvense]
MNPYYNTITDKCMKISFDLIVEAHISLRLTEDVDVSIIESDKAVEMGRKASAFLRGVCNIQILFVSTEALEIKKANSLEPVAELCRDALTIWNEETPVFKKLIQLAIKSNLEVGWEALLGVLMNCPKLQILVIKGLYHRHHDGCGNERLENIHFFLSSSPVKMFKIFIRCRHICDNRKMDIVQIRHFLEKMPALEKLIVYYHTSLDTDAFNLFKRLQETPKVASPKCKIQVISRNLYLSSTLP